MPLSRNRLQEELQFCPKTMNEISPKRWWLLIPFFTLVMKPFTIGFAQGYFPESSLVKPIAVSKSGRIKFREDWVYKSEHGTLSPLGIKIGYDRFDSIGQKVEEANYDLNGNALLEVTYSYDEWGREIQCLGLKDRNSFYRKWEYSFVDSIKCLEKRVYRNKSNKQRWLYRFDNFGNIVEETNYTPEGDFNYKYIIKYTKFNKPAELTEYSGSGTMYEKWIYLYNKQNQNIEVMQFDASGNLFRKYINKFDEYGNQKEVITLDSEEKELERTVSIYQYFK